MDGFSYSARGWEFLCKRWIFFRASGILKWQNLIDHHSIYSIFSLRTVRIQTISQSFCICLFLLEIDFNNVFTREKLHDDASVTGGAIDFQRATTSLTQKVLSAPKKVTLVRHGLSSWNDEGRVQGSSNLSILTEIGVRQTEMCRKALKNIL
ncbi:hypothetical protein Ddye_019233 [Dipteronia dyeriana]|uniref:Uncharacterized protein n=1 Tax=Dipteronia dyeriana TaxID=168575 RepID=A0AAD9TY13_9ROSI|nr:hypothetical protein Ddye_019233 [Dipteronia dyeriana]